MTPSFFPALTGAVEIYSAILDRFRDLQDEERIGRGMPSSLRYCALGIPRPIRSGRGMPSSLRYCALGIPRPIRSSSMLGHTSRLTAVSWSNIGK